MNTSILDNAIAFAVSAHSSAERRGKGFPYIVHPMEAVAIVATISNDQELLAAAILHDVVEDTDVTIEEIESRFGKRVAEIVRSESDTFIEGISTKDSWHVRKQGAITRLKNASQDAKIVAMGDKLSNMRAIARDYAELGDKLWQRFHTTDPAEHEWHYRGLAASLSELSDTDAYREFVSLIDRTFAPKCDAFSYKKEKDTIFVYGAIGKAEAKALIAEHKERTLMLDFSGVTSINFAALRALLNAQNDGINCRISNASPKVQAMFDSAGVSKFISVCSRPREFDMSTLKRSGEGYCSESYFCDDNDSMVKIYSESVPQSALDQEKRYAQAALFCGIPTPLSGELIKVGGRRGIVFERIMEKKSIARAIADDPDNIEIYIKQFAEICKKLHSTPCDTNLFPSVSAQYREITTNTKMLDDDVKKAILKLLDEIPETGCCLHGDLHIGNVIIADGKCIFIDMGDFGYGNAKYDLASFYFTCCFTPEDRAINIYHLETKTLRRCWELFLHYYYDVDTPEEIARIEKELHPYAATRLLYFCKNAEMNFDGTSPEQTAALIRSMMKIFIH